MRHNRFSVLADEESPAERAARFRASEEWHREAAIGHLRAGRYELAEASLGEARTFRRRLHMITPEQTPTT